MKFFKYKYIITFVIVFISLISCSNDEGVSELVNDSNMLDGAEIEAYIYSERDYLSTYNSNYIDRKKIKITINHLKDLESDIRLHKGFYVRVNELLIDTVYSYGNQLTFSSELDDLYFKKQNEVSIKPFLYAYKQKVVTERIKDNLGEIHEVEVFKNIATSYIEGAEIIINNNFDYNTKINSILPLYGSVGDTITLKGENFCTLGLKEDELATLNLGGLDHQIIFYSDSIIKFKIDHYLTNRVSKIHLNNCGLKVEYPYDFEIEKFSIDSICTKKKFPGDTLKIYGESLIPFSYKNTPSFIASSFIQFSGGSLNENDIIEPLEESSSEMLSIVIPKGLKPGFLDVTINQLGEEVVLKNSFYSNTPKINYISSNIGIGDTIVIKGENLDQLKTKSQDGSYVSFVANGKEYLQSLIVKNDSILSFVVNPLSSYRDLNHFENDNNIWVKGRDNVYDNYHILDTLVSVNYIPPKILVNTIKDVSYKDTVKVEFQNFYHYVNHSSSEYGFAINGIKYYRDYLKFKKITSLDLFDLPVQNGEVNLEVESPLGSDNVVLEMKKPLIESYKIQDDSFVVYGKELGLGYGDSKVLIDNEQLDYGVYYNVDSPISYVDSVVFKLPENFTNFEAKSIGLIVNGVASNKIDFDIKVVKVDDFVIENYQNGDIITLTGENLGSDNYTLSKAEIINKSSNSVSFKFNNVDDLPWIDLYVTQFGSSTKLGTIYRTENGVRLDQLFAIEKEDFSSTFIVGDFKSVQLLEFNNSFYKLDKNFLHEYNDISGAWKPISVPPTSSNYYNHKYPLRKNEDYLYNYLGENKYAIYSFKTQDWEEVDLTSVIGEYGINNLRDVILKGDDVYFITRESNGFGSYNRRTKTFKRLPNEIPVYGRGGLDQYMPQTYVSEDKLYVLETEGDYLIKYFDFYSSTWGEIEHPVINNGSSSSYYSLQKFAIVEIENKLYINGGVIYGDNGMNRLDVLDKVLVYDLVSKQWTEKKWPFANVINHNFHSKDGYIFISHMNSVSGTLSFGNGVFCFSCPSSDNANLIRYDYKNAE